MMVLTIFEDQKSYLQNEILTNIDVLASHLAHSSNTISDPVFKQDNARPEVSGSTKGRPPYCSNLNPIVNIRVGQAKETLRFKKNTHQSLSVSMKDKICNLLIKY